MHRLIVPIAESISVFGLSVSQVIYYLNTNKLFVSDCYRTKIADFIP